MSVAPYSLVRSRKARHMRITVYPEGWVRVTAPFFIPEFLVNKFVSSRAEWINGKLEYFRKRHFPTGKSLLRTQNRRQYQEDRDKALELVYRRLEYFNGHYKFAYNKITIRNQKSRWGSCSHKGNTSFNYKILYISPELQDYIIVHELCHLKEMNHSKRFWDLVAEMVPKHSELRARLRRL